MIVAGRIKVNILVYLSNSAFCHPMRGCLRLGLLIRVGG